MQLIHDHLHVYNRELPQIALKAERQTLAKRRWRALADDGLEFGFDLEFPLSDGDVFFVTDQAIYVVTQLPEPILEVALGQHAPGAARLGWIIGNLHFPIAIEGCVLHALDDPAIRQLLTREQIAFVPENKVFRALSGGHSHSHEH